MWTWTKTVTKVGFLILFRLNGRLVAEMELCRLPKYHTFLWGNVYPPKNVKEQAMSACSS